MNFKRTIKKYAIQATKYILIFIILICIYIITLIGTSLTPSSCMKENVIKSSEILKDEGYWIYGADAGGDTVKDFLTGKAKVSDKVAIVMGSEGSGMSRIVKENCDKIISIPTCGKLDSLNVSVAAGILLYNFRNF